MHYDENIDENKLLFFEATLNSLNDLITIFDGAKKIIYVNNAARSVLGYNIEELFDGGIELIDRDITLWQLQRVYSELQNAGKVAFESWYTTKEGRRFPVEVNIYTYDYNGKMYTFYQAKDITEKRLIEKSVAKIRTQYRMLIEGSTDAIAMYDTECRRTFANQTLARIMGKSVYELVGARPSRETHSDSMAAYEAKMKEAMRTGEALEHELYLRAPSDSKLRCFNISIAPEYDEECEVVGVMCRARDITEVKEAETHLNTIVENLPDMVCRLDTKGRFTFVSSSVSRNFHTPKEFFLGKSIEELKTKESERDRTIYEAFKNAVKFGCQSSCEAEWSIHSEKRRFLVRVIPEKNERDAVISALCIATDITELKRQEELLFANEEKFRTLVENAQECIARYDGKCKAVYIDPVMEATLGIATAKARGKSDLEFAMGDVCHEYEDALRSVVKSGKSSDFYFTVPIDNSYWHVTITPEKNRDKECIGVMTVGRNITTLRDMQIELKRREEYQRTILDNSPYFVWLKDENGRLLAANSIYAKHAKVASTKELEGKSDFDFFPRELAQKYVDDDKAVMSGGVPRVFEELFCDENDELRWIETWKSPVIVEGKSVGTVGCARDITESKKLREELIAKERELSALADSSPGMMGSFYLRADGSMCMPYVSQNIWELFGLRPQDVANDATPLLALTHPDDLLRLSDSIAASAKTMTTWREEYRVLHPLFGERWMKGHAKPQSHPDGGVVWYGYVHDVTDMRTAESRVDFLAYHDQLTGLPNRVLAKDRAKQMFAKARRIGKKAALLFADLDNFKTVNDSMGHETGDKLLKQAADRLKSSVRESDTVSRYGGDEFLALLPDLDDSENAAKVAAKILSAFEAPFFVDDKIFSVTISIGISIFCEDGDDFEVLLKKADTALNEAKDAGKNIYYFFTRQMNEDVMRRLQVHNDLKSAVKNGELELYYQPQIDIANGSLVGAEALLRWNHPTMGLVPPLDFIPAAEAGGLIVEIGEWVIAEACAQAVKWQKEHKRQIVVAVNISAIQFKRGDLKGAVVSALKESGLAPHCLELELTESILIKDTNTVLETVKELKAMGVKLSIDDFGTGYSSLSYLKRFAVDKLKIDRSFIQELGDNQESSAIVKAIIQMAKSLNLRTIAEGIETHDALESLTTHGCDEAQGFLFSKPIPACEFEAYLVATNSVF